MADFNKPTTASTYTEVLDELKDRDLDIAKGFATAPTNPVSGMIRWNATTSRHEKYNGSTWVELDTEYDINVTKLGGQLASYYASQSEVDANYLKSQLGTNLLINGDFDVWQRGTSAFTSAGYTADRWTQGITSSTISTIYNYHTFGQTDVTGNPRNYISCAVTSASTASSNAYLQQRIEDVRLLSGSTVTLSFWAKASTSLNLGLEMTQNFGTGGSTGITAADVSTMGVNKVALTTTWTKYTATFTMGSTSGKTIAGGDHFTSLIFWMDAGSDFNTRTDSLGNQSGTFYFSRVQIEEGDTATDYQKRPIGLETELCQRYYETGISRHYHDTGSTLTYGRSEGFQTRKRANPTVTLSGVTVQLSTTRDFEWYAVGVPTGNWVGGSWTAVAEL